MLSRIITVESLQSRHPWERSGILVRWPDFTGRNAHKQSHKVCLVYQVALISGRSEYGMLLHTITEKFCDV